MRTGLACLSLLIGLALQACSKAPEKTQAELDDAAAAEVISISVAGRGEAIAEMACAGCHAVGVSDESLHPDAPPFRLLSQSIDIGSLEQRFAAGNISGHPDMPNWEFEEIDIAGLVAYLESLQGRDHE